MLKKVLFSVLLGANALTPALAWNTKPTGTYSVTVTNQTYGHGFSFPVAATHSSALHVFQVGQLASVQAANVAQTGSPVSTFNFLAGKLSSGEVTDVYGHPFPMAARGASTAPWPAGLPFFDALSSTPGLKPTTTGQTLLSSINFTLGANPSDRLSLVMMMMCTNDGLAGLDSVALPEQYGETKIYNFYAYDAGVEQNTELSADIVDPCGLMAPRAANGDPQVSTTDGNRNSPPTASQTPPTTNTDASIQTSNPIALFSSPTIGGKADIPANFAWNTNLPVGVVTITRIDGPRVDANLTHDSTNQNIHLADVQVLDRHYKVQLKTQGDKLYSLVSADELTKQAHSKPAQYDTNTALLTIPSVEIGARQYRAVLKNLGNFVFRLERLEEPDTAFGL